MLSIHPCFGLPFLLLPTRPSPSLLYPLCFSLPFLLLPTCPSPSLIYPLCFSIPFLLLPDTSVTITPLPALLQYSFPSSPRHVRHHHSFTRYASVFLSFSSPTRPSPSLLYPLCFSLPFFLLPDTSITITPLPALLQSSFLSHPRHVHHHHSFTRSASVFLSFSSPTRPSPSLLYPLCFSLPFFLIPDTSITITPLPALLQSSFLSPPRHVHHHHSFTRSASVFLSFSSPTRTSPSLLYPLCFSLPFFLLPDTSVTITPLPALLQSSFPSTPRHVHHHHPFTCSASVFLSFSSPTRPSPSLLYPLCFSLPFLLLPDTSVTFIPLSALLQSPFPSPPRHARHLHSFTRSASVSLSFSSPTRPSPSLLYPLCLSLPFFLLPDTSVTVAPLPALLQSSFLSPPRHVRHRRSFTHIFSISSQHTSVPHQLTFLHFLALIVRLYTTNV